MYCSKCGQKAFEGARFCSLCGNPFSAAAPIVLLRWPISLAINLNTSLIRTAPYIFWLDMQICGLIKLDPVIFARVTQFAPHEKEKAQAFRDYASTLRTQPFESLFTSCPGSIKFETAQIHSLRLHKYYDSDFHKHMQYARFTMVANAGKFRGSFERDTDTGFLETSLSALLSSRFSSHEIINSLDDD